MRSTRPRAIVHAASFGGAVPGSFIPALARLARHLTEHGDRVTFVMLEVPGATWLGDIKETGADLILVRTVREAVATVIELRPDIVHTHFSDYDVPLILSSGLADARVFWHIHSWPARRDPLGVLRSFVKFRLIGQRVEAFVPVSYALANEYAARGVPRRKLRVVQNGIDCDWFRPPSESERHDARAKLGLNGEKVVLFFGRAPSKGGDVLWRALEQVERARALLVEVPDEDRAEFEKRVSVLAIARTDDTRSLYWAADLLAYPTRMEGFGFVLMEGLATGLPVVASDIPAVREIAAHTSAIRLVPVDDPVALSASIRRSLDDAAARMRNERAVTAYSLDRWLGEMLALYDE